MSSPSKPSLASITSGQSNGTGVNKSSEEAPPPKPERNRGSVSPNPGSSSSSTQAASVDRNVSSTSSVKDAIAKLSVSPKVDRVSNSSSQPLSNRPAPSLPSQGAVSPPPPPPPLPRPAAPPVLTSAATGRSSVTAMRPMSSLIGDAAAAALAAVSTSSQAAPLPINPEIVFQELLSKRNREGKFEKCTFTIMPTKLLYLKFGEAASVPPKEIDLVSVLVTPLKDRDYDDLEKKNRAFRLLSHHKSFLVRAKTVELKEQWMTAIAQAASDARKKDGVSEPLETSLAPIWQLSEDNSCSICNVTFTFFVRRHHCRRCGSCVCENCSPERVRMPMLDERGLYKACIPCAKQLKETRRYGAAIAADG